MRTKKRHLYQQDGIIIDQVATGYHARVRVPGQATYRKRTFRLFEAALEWAKGRQESLDVGGPVSASLGEVAKAFLRQMEARQCTSASKARVVRTAKRAIAAGIRDLEADGVAKQAQEWIEGLTSASTGRPLDPKSRNIYAVTLRSLGRLAVQERMIRRSPFERLRLVPVDESSPGVYRLFDLRRAAGDRYAGTPGWWDFVWILYTGLRVTTAAQAKWSWVHLDEEVLHVPAGCLKGRQGRRRDLIVDLQPELVDLLKMRQEQRDPSPEDSILDPVTFSRARDQVTRRVRNFLDAIGIDPPDHRLVHALRHTHACLLAASGADSWDVQDALGHRTSKMSHHYAQLRRLYRKEVRQEGWPPGVICLRSLPAAEDEDLVVLEG